MICCYLLYSQLFKSAKEALVFYGKIRTSNGKGVTIPSQIRYVYYYDEFLKLKRREFPHRVLTEMPKKVVKIYKIRLISIPSIQGGGFQPLFRVKYPRGDQVVYDSKWEEGPGGSGKVKFLQDELSYFDFRIKSRSLLVDGDVKVEFSHVNSVPPHKREKAFHFWFNTSFID
jgi:phosphatidylinositol-3,4,5-trisphosphate 3-phosphatase/dual-specificity protein phosphatase PTEN